jgi:hypothetical protein
MEATFIERQREFLARRQRQQQNEARAADRRHEGFEFMGVIA